jgi:hypothetical protein
MSMAMISLYYWETIAIAGGARGKNYSGGLKLQRVRANGVRCKRTARGCGALMTQEIAADPARMPTAAVARDIPANCRSVLAIP